MRPPAGFGRSQLKKKAGVVQGDVRLERPVPRGEGRRLGGGPALFGQPADHDLGVGPGEIEFLPVGGKGAGGHFGARLRDKPWGEDDRRFSGDGLAEIEALEAGQPGGIGVLSESGLKTRKTQGEEHKDRGLFHLILHGY